MGLAELTYVTGSDKPCDVGREVRPPKVVDDVCMCSKVSVMSSGVMSGSENCWSFVTVNDYIMMTLWISPPKMTILLEEVSCVVQECGVYGIGESQGTISGAEPFPNMVQMVVSSTGSIGLGE